MAIADSSHAGRPSPPLKAWTIAILAGFGILHVVGGYMLHHAPSTGPSKRQQRRSDGARWIGLVVTRVSPGDPTLSRY